MGWRSVVVSAALHVAAGAMLLGIDHPPTVRLPPAEPIEISLTPAPTPAPRSMLRSPAPALSSSAPAPDRGRARTRERGAAPAPAIFPGPWLRMRDPAAGAEAADRLPPSGHGSEPVVPRPSEIGGLPGAPPADQLPPGALFGPVRAPKPYVPGGDQVQRELGPRMRGDGDGGYREDHPAFSARVDRDGKIHFRDKGNVQIDGITGGVESFGLAGSFDLTDAVLRALGDDPYAYEKLLVMERTREVRAGMAATEKTRLLADSVRKLPALLDHVWAYPRWSPAEKRRVLFALWDEVDEDSGDAGVRRAGAQVRAIIVGFIRRQLPRSGAQAFTAGELDALNRQRRSRARFDPYSD